MKNFSKTLANFVIDSLETLIVGFAVMFLVFFFVAQPLQVTGNSMEPTLKDGEQIIAEKVSLRFEPIKRGDIVIFRHPTSPKILLIKRVVGLPGETISIFDGVVHINGEELTEPYLKRQNGTKPYRYLNEGEDFEIPKNSYVVLGDNRTNSADSRELGPIPEKMIVGKSFLVYSPLSAIRLQ